MSATCSDRELTHLPGYGGARPVRIGNGAALQYQADVVGEVMVAAIPPARPGWGNRPPHGRCSGAAEPGAGRIDEPDSGIWEIRGEPRMFTHSRVMTWAAFDRGVRAVHGYRLPGAVELWQSARDRVRAEIDAKAVAVEAAGSPRYYGTDEADASLLVLPQVGFCAADDPRMLATVERLEQT
ncbi:MAG: glycoside hydrolase family 15 protein [Micropruina glycogenica]